MYNSKPAERVDSAGEVDCARHQTSLAMWQGGVHPPNTVAKQRSISLEYFQALFAFVRVEVGVHRHVWRVETTIGLVAAEKRSSTGAQWLKRPVEQTSLTIPPDQ
ncbi:unnamed protein product, partial [Ectocarpus sp. 8 AP-2014]